MFWMLWEDNTRIHKWKVTWLLWSNLALPVENKSCRTVPLDESSFSMKVLGLVICLLFIMLYIEITASTNSTCPILTSKWHAKQTWTLVQKSSFKKILNWISFHHRDSEKMGLNIHIWEFWSALCILRCKERSHAWNEYRLQTRPCFLV